MSREPEIHTEVDVEESAPFYQIVESSAGGIAVSWSAGYSSVEDALAAAGKRKSLPEGETRKIVKVKISRTVTITVTTTDVA